MSIWNGALTSSLFEMRRKEEMKYGKSEMELKEDEMRLALVKHRRETEEAELERRRKGEFATIHFYEIAYIF